jgi:hypothetical protein
MGFCNVCYMATISVGMVMPYRLNFLKICLLYVVRSVHRMGADIAFFGKSRIWGEGSGVRIPPGVKHRDRLCRLPRTGVLFRE